MKRQLLMKWASVLAMTLVYLGLAVPLTALADETLTIGTMEDGSYAVNVTVNGGKGATVAISVNGEQQVSEKVSAGGTVSAHANQADAVSISVSQTKPSSWMVKSFEATESNGTVVECQEEKTLDSTGGYYVPYIYSFTMPASDVTATCALDGSTWTRLTAYCVAGWEDFDFALKDKSGEPIALIGEGVLDESAGANQGVSYRKYLIQSGEYTYTMSDVKADATIDSGAMSLKPGSYTLNWNLLNVTVEPAVVEGLGTFGTASCVCKRADDGEEKLPIASSVDESGIYTATFLLKGGDAIGASTSYKVSATPEDEGCSLAWVADWVDNVQLTGEDINVTAILNQRCIARATLRASELMKAQGKAITELNGHVDPANYLKAQQAEIAQVIADATEAIKKAANENEVKEALDIAKQALEAVETAEEAQAAAAPVVQAIAALPAADALTAENADAVKAARAAYDALTDAQKAAVGEDNVLKLESAEAAVEAAIAAEKAKADADAKAKADAAAKAALAAASNVNKPAFTAADAKKASDLGATTITLGPKVKKIAKGAFAGTKITTIIVKTKKLKKKSVKGSLKGSSVKTVKVQVGKKKANKKYVKKYKKIFTKKNAGKKAKVK